tara:strand:- start:708 stop:1049 length:342 start_codon:yes stop_codon:yes gene_type:complete
MVIEKGDPRKKTDAIDFHEMGVRLGYYLDFKIGIICHYTGRIDDEGCLITNTGKSTIHYKPEATRTWLGISDPGTYLPRLLESVKLAMDGEKLNLVEDEAKDEDPFPVGLTEE